MKRWKSAQKAELEGKEAFKAGKLLTGNPHKKSDWGNGGWWEKGWFEGQEAKLGRRANEIQ